MRKNRKRKNKERAKRPVVPVRSKQGGLSGLGAALLDAIKRSGRLLMNERPSGPSANASARPGSVGEPQGSQLTGLQSKASNSKQRSSNRQADATDQAIYTHRTAKRAVGIVSESEYPRLKLRSENEEAIRHRGPSARECIAIVEDRITELMRVGKNESLSPILAATNPADHDELSFRLDSRGKSRATGERRKPQAEVHLGIDFGTSSTKIIAGLPFEAGAPSFAVPALASVRLDNHPYLWASRLWVFEDGVCSIVPEADAIEMGRLKTDIILGRDQIGLSVDNVPVTPEEAACAYLALQIRQAKGWLFTEHPAVFRRRHIDWFVNFGFPATTLDNAQLAERYRSCCAAALRLERDGVEVTLPRVREALASISGNSENALADLQGDLAPEIAATVAGFAHSQRLEEEGGMFTMIDVGGTTVDCCTFRLFKDREGVARCPILEADVRRLGVEPWQLWQADGGQSSVFRSALDGEFSGVIWRTRANRNPRSKRWKEGLPVFFAGGGTGSMIHREAVEDLDPWLRKSDHNSEGIILRALEPPTNLQHPLCNGDVVHRLCVAMGLSRPSYEIPKAQLPSTIEDVPAPHRRNLEDRFVGPEQT